MKVAIFPSGLDGRKLADILEKKGEVELVCFVDNNPNMLGKQVVSHIDAKVVSPYKLKQMLKDEKVDQVLVLSSMMISYGLDELMKQLDLLGIKSYKIVPSYILRKTELTEEDYKEIFTDERQFNQLQHLQFHIADNCNLKCKRCQHFSNLVENNVFPEIKTIEKDLKRLSKLFDNINVIAILGGEPLLNKNLASYCYLTREYFRYSKIEIISNGLLINKMSDELVEAIKANDILINISFYPVLETIIDDIVFFLIEHGIRYTIGNRVSVFSKKLTLQGNENPEKSFSECRDRCCTTLREGKLYPCYLPATAFYLNQKFKTNISGADSAIDIYSGITGLEIINRLKRKFDICKYCSDDVILPWEQSKEVSIEDWVV